MERKRVTWAPPPVEPLVAAVGQPAGGTCTRWSGPRASLRQLERPEACQQMLRRVRGLDGKIRDAG